MAWQDDQLGRAEFGQHVIALLIARYLSRGSLIANLDAGWGEGKTFFLQNLTDQLREEGYPVAYVNAWTDDRSDDPLLTVLAAVTSAIDEKLDSTSAAAKTLGEAQRKLAPILAEASKQMALHALKLTTGVAIDKAIEAAEAEDDWEADQDAIGTSIDALSKVDVAAFVDQRLAAHRADRAAIDSFREQTAEALKTAGIQLPLFVIVDELDRCRPNYAVRVLEDLRHVFDIEGCVFLIGTDTRELAHSVTALYGNDFNSQTYLRRFFDRVIVFPPVSRAKLFMNMIGDTKFFEETFAQSENVPAVSVFVSLFESQHYSNRDIEQFVELLDTFIASWEHDLPIEPILLAALIDDYLKHPTKFVKTKSLIRSAERQAWRIAEAVRGDIDLDAKAASILRVSQQDLRTFDWERWPAQEYFRTEYNLRVAKEGTRSPVASLVSEYRERVYLSGRQTQE